MKRFMTTLTTLILLAGLAATAQAAYDLTWTVTPNAATSFDGIPLYKVVGNLEAGEGELVTAMDLSFTGMFYQDWMFDGAVPTVYADLFGIPTPGVDTHLLLESAIAMEAVRVVEDNNKASGGTAGWGTSVSGAFGIQRDYQQPTVDFIQMYVAAGTTVNYNIATPGGDFVGCGYLEYFPELSCNSTPDVAHARVDTPATITLTVENVSDESSELNGTFPSASGEFGPGNTSSFGPLDQFESDSRQYTYTPTTRGSDTQSITVTSNGGNSGVTLSGIGVGPVYDSNLAPGSTLDFDEVLPGTPQSIYLDISNTTTDENGGDDALTDLTLLDVTIDGSDSDLFDIVGFPLNTLVHKDDTLSLELRYNGTGTPGQKNVTLYVFTDEDVALGANGSSFSYSISADVVPEPGTLVLLLCGLVSLGFWRRRRDRRAWPRAGTVTL